MISAGAAPQNAYSNGIAPHLSSVIRFVGYSSIVGGTPPYHVQTSTPICVVESSLDNPADCQLEADYCVMSNADPISRVLQQ